MDLKTEDKIAFGGGCHWCTEAVFQSLKGVRLVEQGYVSSFNDNASFSEAVIVYYNPKEISEDILLEIHLHTHNSRSNHSMREKYRSAVYVFSEGQEHRLQNELNRFQNQFDNRLVTKIYWFNQFESSRESIRNYYLKNPEKPFCKRFINPRLSFLLEHYSGFIKPSFTTSPAINP
ncbi:peptide methionine sulfoxide reductase MsrA [Formosa agariphila KMM 3901]|uniref:peptide-methionine (S)-S-oxide reductase n=1 Tax=Formosa agariphila (strain DSM 15362 / KCTC 12365 / LMG 23005 / KMM 3901 / M-2Alg 35-1) TaxID=1347342 RepID=T2KQF9_FORAG|nr:peptide-methionine (S)-S-oxide reductase [Formosa agariphila]CDF80738.1 peptide methionine sulfoxide reductase MsrA [Formosa agariphila KMM 3901]